MVGLLVIQAIAHITDENKHMKPSSKEGRGGGTSAALQSGKEHDTSNSRDI